MENLPTVIINISWLRHWQAEASFRDESPLWNLLVLCNEQSLLEANKYVARKVTKMMPGISYLSCGGLLASKRLMTLRNICKFHTGFACFYPFFDTSYLLRNLPALQSNVPRQHLFHIFGVAGYNDHQLVFWICHCS